MLHEQTSVQPHALGLSCWKTTNSPQQSNAQKAMEALHDWNPLETFRLRSKTSGILDAPLLWTAETTLRASDTLKGGDHDAVVMKRSLRRPAQRRTSSSRPAGFRSHFSSGTAARGDRRQDGPDFLVLLLHGAGASPDSLWLSGHGSGCCRGASSGGRCASCTGGKGHHKA